MGIRGIHYISVILLLTSIAIICDEKIFWKVIKAKPVTIWVIWAVYAYFNWMSKGIFLMDSPTSFVLMRFVLPVGMMLIVFYEASINLELTSKVVLFTLIIYVLIGIFFQDAGTGQGNDWEGRGGELLGNMLPLNACCMAFIAVVYCVAFRKKKSFLYLCLGLALAGIIFTSTRKAVAGWGIIVIFYILSTLDMKKSKTIVRFVLSVMILGGIAYLLMHNTMLGERFAETENQSEKALAVYANTPPILNFLGDRALHYMLGWELFLEHPVTGIGIYNFKALTGFPVPLHTEYMTQLCENGIIGFTLYLLFIFSLFHIVWETYKKGGKSIGIVCAGGLFAILFIALTGWTYEATYYFAEYGLIQAYCTGVINFRLKY